ncbi:hypothetical protein BMJ13_07985 [Staphylococcus saprophyticus]|uniref:hypothetical protein n=1 Tax=Staphylococcus saprophyticus TaxID=29385 RepID=UPI00094B890C|nr:hypothetical protein [Staphylococcus saprophyticus]OLN92927.1 hypothetical protein BMJ13_07985 [Staphylococcus saprophyticus]
MAKDSVKAYGEMTDSIKTYGTNKVNEFVMRNDSIETMFHRLIIEEMIDVKNKIVVYNLDNENRVLRFYYIDNSILTKVVLKKEDGTFNCLNIQTKPYLISVDGDNSDISELISSADIYYSQDFTQKVTIKNPKQSNIDFPNFISQLKL